MSKTFFFSWNSSEFTTVCLGSGCFHQVFFGTWYTYVVSNIFFLQEHFLEFLNFTYFLDFVHILYQYMCIYILIFKYLFLVFIFQFFTSETSVFCIGSSLPVLYICHFNSNYFVLFYDFFTIYNFSSLPFPLRLFYCA